MCSENLCLLGKEQQAGDIWTEPTLHAIRMRTFEHRTENTVV